MIARLRNLHNKSVRQHHKHRIEAEYNSRFNTDQINPMEFSDSLSLFPLKARAKSNQCTSSNTFHHSHATPAATTCTTVSRTIRAQNVQPSSTLVRMPTQNVPLVLSIIGILVMPFTAIFAFIFVIPSFLIVQAHKRITHEYRTPLWAMKSLNQNQMLIRIAFAEFVAMLVISSFWPNAFNWW